MVPGWKKAGWFGFFLRMNPWVYHQGLGWIYVTENSERGAWFHREIWVGSGRTLKFFQLCLWQIGSSGLDMELAKTTLFDYLRQEWFELTAPCNSRCGAW